MTAPWKNWCRLCANPHGSVSILNYDGNSRLGEKIRKYLSISVSEEDEVSCLLCSKCCDQLTAFDEFVHHCFQVQEMFDALCELVGDDVADERLTEIRKEFLDIDFESCRDKPINGNVFSSHVRKRPSEEGKENSPNKIRKENGNDRKQISPVTKRKICEERSVTILEDNTIDCRKNGPLKEIAELKQAFGDENEIMADSLDSDFNEESFGNLLNSDAFQPALRNPSNGFKTKSDDKLIQNSGLKNTQLLEPSRQNESERCSVIENRVPEIVTLSKRHDVLKLRDDNGCNNELGCNVLSTNVNGVASISDSDINDFIYDDNTEDENVITTIDSGNNPGGEEFNANGAWKSQEKSRNDESSKILNEQDSKFYELREMFVDADIDEGCTGSNTDEKIKTSKKAQTELKCNLCDKSFYRKATLDAHMVSHVPKDQQPFACCKCGRRFHCESLLRNHERVHLPNEEKLVFPCHVCSKKFSSRSAVTAHLRAVHYGERPFVCHLCGNSFTSKGVLQEHLTIHSDEEPWHCTQCTKKFKTKYRLKIHMDTHRETPYSCPHCPVQLSTRRTLRMHLVVHQDDKAYQCATCGKAFRRAKDLKNHQNLHTGRKPYVCPFCSRSFANGSNCRSHKRRMHPEELRQYEAALATKGGSDLLNNASPLETDTDTNMIMDDEGNQSMKEDSQDSLLTEMALDLQQPQILSDKTGLATVDDDPVATAADLTLAPLVTLTPSFPKLEPDDSRLVMNLTTQIHDNHDSMEAMSPLNLNIMSPMNLNISSPLNLNISSPLNLNISSVLHSPTGRNQQQHSIQHHHNHNRYQQAHQQPQQQPLHLTMQPTQHQTHQQMQQHHHHQLPSQPHLHQQMQHQHLQRSPIQMTTMQTSLSSTGAVHTLSSQTQLPAHLNNTVHHTPQMQTFVPINQQSALYAHHTPTPQDSVSSTSSSLVATAAVAHSMAASSSTTLPSFASTIYVQHPMAYARGTNM
ncbi:hypothetical protein ONE63_007786 [Megalurothrips usitatus]|uniref:Uncharacterized protein n=1 Tax=Megalurothrips usitatus TaxID=439358 RepID=A0AAV7XS46_9NEOP|nr:hypothetical protein ONE63_007786 [Megalurothrips usitatus]